MAAETGTASPSPQDTIRGMVMGITQGRCLVAAAELGIADALAGGPLHVDAIAARTNADANNLFRLMRALETVGVFEEVSPRVFANSPLSEFLREDVPGSQRAFLRIVSPGFGIWEGYGELLRTLQSGRTALFESWGYDIWEHYRKNPERAAVFNQSMRSMTAPMTPAVTAAYDWSRYPVIADIGGSIGTQLVDILNAHPGCRGVIFDQPAVLAEAIPHDRLERVGGSFFENIPVEADAYILRNVIHDWNDQDAARILKSVRKAAKSSSRVALIEWLIPETPGFHLGKWTDMVMMAAVGGRERTKSDFESLFRETGFALEEVAPTASIFTIVVGRPV